MLTGLATGIKAMISNQSSALNVFARDVKETVSHLRSRYKRDGQDFIDLATGDAQSTSVMKDVRQVFAFAVGGGSFYEYESFKLEVEQWDQQQASVSQQPDGGKKEVKRAEPALSVIYGCDHIYEPRDFLEEILRLN